MSTATRNRKPAVRAPQGLAVDFGAEILREHTEWAWALGIGEPRLPTKAEIEKYEARKDDPAFAALYAMAERAAAGEDITALPVTAVPAGPAPELERTARMAQAEADAAAFGLVTWPAARPVAVIVPPAPDPFDSDKHFGPRREGALARFEAAHAAEPDLPDPVLTPDEDAPGTAIMPVADVITGAMEAIGDDVA
jgi:hypothetical protein